MSRIIIIAFKLVVCAFALAADSNHPGDLHTRAGSEHYTNHRYAEAEQEFRQALAIYRADPSSQKLTRVSALDYLANALYAQGKVTEARKAFEEVVSLEPHMGEYREPVLVNALNNLALTYHIEIELSKAVALLRRALTISVKDGIPRAGTLHNLGAVYFDMRQWRKAEDLFEQALAMSRNAGGSHFAPTTLTYLARLAASRGDSTRADSLMQQALEIRRRASPDDISLAVTLGDIGQWEKDRDHFEQAAQHFQEALALLDARYGTDHVFSAPILFQFGQMYSRQGLHEEALRRFQRSITILTKAYGPNHPRLGALYQNAALSSAKLKRKDEAKSYARRADAIQAATVDFGKHSVDARSFLPGK